jgi:hypothetical protein
MQNDISEILAGKGRVNSSAHPWTYRSPRRVRPAQRLKVAARKLPKRSNFSCAGPQAVITDRWIYPTALSRTSSPLVD